VLNTVNIIRNEGMAMELRYIDLEERYRTRLLFATTDEETAQCTDEMGEALQVRPPSLSSLQVYG
jgi:dynein heavy chain